MQETSLAIGIDVGWSEKSRTCALGLKGDLRPLLNDLRETRFTVYNQRGDDSEVVAVGAFRKSELIAFLTSRLSKWADIFSRSFLIIDGPLGRSVRPTQNRHVDSAFRRGDFNRRVQPSDICGESGKTYVDATYALLQPFFDVFERKGGFVQAPFGTFAENTRLVYGETHPTVGLCLCLPPQDKTLLPSYKNPKLCIADNCTYRTKSDWYWRIGACNTVEQLLGADVKVERHHDHIAGLYCLAVAEGLRNPGPTGSSVIACGDHDGVYLFPSQIHCEWSDGLKDQVGIYSGTPIPIRRSIEVPELITIPSADTPIAVNLTDESAELDESAEQGDLPLHLVLNNNGGIWEKHNPWLSDLEPGACLRILGADQLELTLLRVGGVGQWTFGEKDTTPRSLARQFGFHGDHLSGQTPWRIWVEIVSDTRSHKLYSSESQG